MLDGVLISKQNIIPTPGGSVMHAMKSSDPGAKGFGEAYFSTVDPGFIKGWKRHKKMTLNLLVPFGEIRFVLYDDRASESKRGIFQDVILSPQNYSRLTVPPNIWIAFQGLASGRSLLLNLANIPHDPLESDTKQLDEIDCDWNSNK
jgi:dTDP-4-dehydrorhamnose 3,5-epimerase